MFRSIASKLKGQKGGAAILTSMGFLLFSIPMISGSLGLADSSIIDSRVSNDAMHRDYCTLAVQEYIGYLLTDTTRWNDWLSANVDPEDPDGYTGTLNLCGEDITLSVGQIDPELDGEALAESGGYTPNAGAYNQREIQTLKTVSNSNPDGGDPVTYTISMVNRSDDSVNLNQIRDTLPAGFTYDCSAPDQLTLPGQAAQDITPSNGSGCPSGTDVEWSIPSSPSVQPDEVVTLSFTAITSEVEGTYCNQAQVVPGGDKTGSGQTARVDIDTVDGLCPGDAVEVSQDMVSATLVYTDDSVIPYVYSFDVIYDITIENIGDTDVTLAGFVDLLPPGHAYFATEPTGTITDAPSNLHLVPQLDRQRVTWDFSPQVVVASGGTATLTFKANSVATTGTYWTDLLVSFANGLFPEQKYTWPTAVVSVKDVYEVIAVDESGNEIVSGIQVWIEGESGIIANWGL